MAVCIPLRTHRKPHQDRRDSSSDHNRHVEQGDRPAASPPDQPAGCWQDRSEIVPSLSRYLHIAVSVQEKSKELATTGECLCAYWTTILSLTTLVGPVMAMVKDKAKGAFRQTAETCDKFANDGAESRCHCSMGHDLGLITFQRHQL